MSAFSDRLSDLRVGASFTAGRLVGNGTGTWDKFLFDGGSGTLADKPGDYDITSKTAIAALFKRDEFAGPYMAAVSSSEGGAAKVAVQNKLKADMLASMQQAIGLRYSSRIRHMAAAASRLRSIGGMDAEIMKLRAENV